MLDPLIERMHRLARQERFEEAAEVRERGALLERALQRRIGARALAAAGTIRLGLGGRELRIDNGRLGDADSDVGAEREANVIDRWLRRADHIELLSVTGTWALPITARPHERFKVRSP